jgi:hypothetical protein
MKESLYRMYSNCQQYLKFPRLPSKYYTGPMLLNFRVQMGTGVSSIVNLLTGINVFNSSVN